METKIKLLKELGLDKLGKTYQNFKKKGRKKYLREL